MTVSTTYVNVQSKTCPTDAYTVLLVTDQVSTVYSVLMYVHADQSVTRLCVIAVCRWSFWEMQLGNSLFEELFTHCKQILRPADTGSKLSLLEFYLNTVTQDSPNASHKAAGVKSCLTQVFQCAAILHQVTSYGFAAPTTTAAQPAIKQEALQADTVTDMGLDTEMQKLPVLDRPSAEKKQHEGKPGKTAAGASVMEETGCSNKAEVKGHQSMEVQTLQSLDDLCR